MTQVHFTLKSEEIQSIIEYSVKDDVSKNILTTVFNQRKRLIFRYDRKIPDYFSVAGAP